MRKSVEKLAFDFDDVSEWGPNLADFLHPLLPGDIGETIRCQAPEYIEDACDLLFDHTNRAHLIEQASRWIKEQSVYGYHGTRLTLEEQNGIRSEGLKPLVAVDRATRLRRSLSKHERWPEIEAQLDGVIEQYGSGEFDGRREGQVHLTISRAGLTNGFNHYIKHGAEFDIHVARHLLEEDGPALLAADGAPCLIKVRVPGTIAFEACNPFGVPPDMPNLIREILKAWSFWLAYPEFNPATLKVDCGMFFREPVPAKWIEDIMILET